MMQPEEFGGRQFGRWSSFHSGPDTGRVPSYLVSRDLECRLLWKHLESNSRDFCTHKGEIEAPRKPSP